MQLDFYSFIRMLWERKPNIIILFVAGLIVFVLLVIDAYLLKKRRTRPHSERPPRPDFRSQLLTCRQRFRATKRKRPQRRTFQRNAFVAS